MNKKKIQAICYALAAVIACMISASGILPSGSKKEIVSKETDALSDSSAGLAASAGSIHTDEPKIDSSDIVAFDDEPQIVTSDNASLDDEPQTVTSAALDNRKKDGKTSETAADDEDPETVTDDEMVEPEVVKTGPYYTYRITMNPESLNIYSDPESKDSFDSVPSGYHGYVIKKLDGYRSLVLYRGKIGYCSNMYLEMTEIPPEEYPDELVGLSEEDIGTTLFGGASVGTAEGRN